MCSFHKISNYVTLLAATPTVSHMKTIQAHLVIPALYSHETNPYPRTTMRSTRKEFFPPPFFSSREKLGLLADTKADVYDYGNRFWKIPKKERERVWRR